MSVGLSFDFPIRNRAARSKYRVAQLELAKEVAELENTVDQVRLEVEESINGMAGARQQFQVRKQSAEKSQAVVDSLLQRRRIFPQEFDQITQLYVREILDAQQRTAIAQAAIVDLLSRYAIDTVLLRKAMGILLSRFGPAGPPGVVSRPAQDRNIPGPQMMNPGPQAVDLTPQPTLGLPVPEVVLSIPVENESGNEDSSNSPSDLLLDDDNSGLELLPPPSEPPLPELGLPQPMDSIPQTRVPRPVPMRLDVSPAMQSLREAVNRHNSQH